MNERTAEKVGKEWSMPREIIEGLIWEAGITVLIGNFNVGKSPLLLDWIIRFAHGIPLNKRKCLKRRVIYLGLEDQAGVVYERMKRICKRLKVPFPDMPDQFDPYFATGDYEDPGTEKLWRAQSSRLPDVRWGWIKSLIVQSPEPAIVVIDPIQLFTRFRTNDEIERVIIDVKRIVLRARPETAMIWSMNTRKQDTRQVNAPTLLKNPHAWLECVQGGKDALARADGRLGVERWTKEGAEVNQILVNGTGRGQSGADPLVAESMPLGESEEESELAGFDYISEKFWLEVMTEKQLNYWNRLPRQFRWGEIRGKIIPPGGMGDMIRAFLRYKAIEKLPDGSYKKREV
jgi:hypothetical protein